MLFTAYLSGLIFIIGCCVGSFLNVVILRAFSGESIVYPPSKCPVCGKSLKWYHNIPIISYMFLKGKCAYCKAKISLQYPIIEFLTGILYIFCFVKFQYNIIPLLFAWYFISVFIVLAVCDIKEKVIFDFHSYFLILGGLILNYFNGWNLYHGQKLFTVFSKNINIEISFIYAVLGIIAGIILMESLARLGYLFAGTRAFGEGDTYIAAGLGAIFGYKFLVTALICALIIQIIFTFPFYIKKLFDKKDARTIIGFALFLIIIILLKTAEYCNVGLKIYLIGLILLLASGLYICKRIISNIKTSNENELTFLPFGPAMVISAIYLMFSL